MESEDFIALPPDCSDAKAEDANDEVNDGNDSKEVDVHPTISEDKEEKPNSENLGHEGIAQCEEGECIPEASTVDKLADNNSNMDAEGVNNELNDGNDSKEVDAQPPNSEDKEEKPNGENLGQEGIAECEEGECIPEASTANDLVDNNPDMDTEDPNNELNDGNDSTEVDAQPTNSEDKEEKPNSENLGQESVAQCEEGECILEASTANELVDNDSDMEIEDINNLPPLTSSGPGEGDVHTVNIDSHSTLSGNGHLAVQDTSPFGIHSINVTPKRCVKRARTTVDEQQASVRIAYNFLTRASKQKLEELLQNWSEWHVKHVSSSQDPTQVLESGEETLFPALHVGTGSGSGVSFWMDNQSRTAQNREPIPLDSNSAPLYDRGYALGLTLAGGSTNQEGGLEIIGDASRCFNCGSYNHAMKECPKPRNHAAVNSARKQLKIKKNQTPNSRNSTRYYQNTPAGKYDGLRPGALDAETRKLLGLGELDPPPWLNRMQELGYPPGYFDVDVDDEDQPSGIVIHGGEETKVEQEDGEIIETGHPEPPEPRRKMTVEFPGVNAPIPANADERLWADPRNRLHNRSSHFAEPVSRSHYREQRWSRDYSDDGPPGVDPGYAPSGYPSRHGSHDYGYNSRGPSNASAPRSPTLGRSRSERERRSSEFSFPYSPTKDSDPKYDYLNNESKNDHDHDSSSHSWERVDRHRHHRRR